MKIHTSESLKAQDGDCENYHYELSYGEKYQLTSSEIQWLDFIDGRYAIADHIRDNSETDDNGNLIYTMEPIGLSEALKDDDSPHKAVMLSDDSTLQAIFFYSNHND